MNLDVLFNAPLAIQIHVYAAVLAAILGALVLWRRKGTTSHKRLGKVWVMLMAVTALSSFFIHQIKLVGLFSPIHLISIGVLLSLYFGVKQAKAGNIAKHKSSMKSTYIGGIGIAGGLTFLPGRMMYEVTLAPTVEKIFGMTDGLSILSNQWFFPVLVGVAILAMFVVRVIRAK